MTIRQIRLGSRKWSIRTRPMLNVGLLVMLVLWSSVLACSKVKEEGDPKSLSYDHYCPDLPSGVKCPNSDNSTDNTTTTSGTVMREYFDLDTSISGSTSVQSSKMYWGRWYPTEGYWYLDLDNKIRQGCLPLQQTDSSNGQVYAHYSSPRYWNSPIGRNSEPPYARCYRAWKTDNATSCYGQQLCIDRGKTEFKRTMMIGQGNDWSGSYGPFAYWGPGHQDNVSLVGTTFACGTYPNGQCNQQFFTTYFQDNHTGKVLDNGSYDGHEVPPNIWSNVTHVCTKEDGSSCAYVD